MKTLRTNLACDFRSFSCWKIKKKMLVGQRKIGKKARRRMKEGQKMVDGGGKAKKKKKRRIFLPNFLKIRVRWVEGYF